MEKKMLLLFVLITTLVIQKTFSMEEDDDERNCEYIKSISKEFKDSIINMFKKLLENPDELSFTECNDLTDGRFEIIINCLNINHTLKKFKYINIAYALITDKTLELIAEYYPAIIKINLFGCNRISANGIRILTEKCPKLQSITLPSHIT